MSPSAVVMMVLICGFVWGGFTILLTRAIRREGDKQRVDRQRAHRQLKISTGSGVGPQAVIHEEAD